MISGGPGEIKVYPSPPQTTHFRALIADGGPLFLTPFATHRRRVEKWTQVEAFLSAIRGRKGGPVNWRGLPRESRG